MVFVFISSIILGHRSKIGSVVPVITDRARFETNRGGTPVRCVVDLDDPIAGDVAEL